MALRQASQEAFLLLLLLVLSLNHLGLLLSQMRQQAQAHHRGLLAAVHLKHLLGLMKLLRAAGLPLWHLTAVFVAVECPHPQ
mmetsp:Transcript_9746/g.20611  ORF Transcript_9746/g.20611 Transcript_9746/m.20611 type:complete len:82 (-) Transcript_9746:1791-2036(-)